MKRQSLALILLASATLGSIRCAADAVYSDGIAAVVNGQVITVFDIMRETQQIETAMRRELADEDFAQRAMELRKDVAQRLVDRALIYEEYKRQKFELPGRFIRERLDEIVVERANGDWQKFERDLLKSGMSMDEFREHVEKQLAVDVLINQHVRRPAYVTPAEIVDFYQNNTHLYHEAAEVRLRLIAVTRDDKTEQELQAVLDAVKQDLSDGRPFEDIATERSDDMSANRGGDVGWIGTDTGREEFIHAVQSLETGEVSDPVFLAEAVYVIQLVDTKDAVQHPLDDALKTQIEARLLEDKRKDLYDEFVQRLRDKFYVKLYF